MTASRPESCSEAECEAALGRLFPHGFGGDDVLAEIAPEGWESSPLRAVFHPSLAQVYEETLRLHRHLRGLRRRADAPPPPPEPTLEEVARGFQDRPGEPEREVAELVGMCLWDVFSDNHDVVAADGRVLHLGSFRGSGGFLADLLNRQVGERRYGYLDFYLGTIYAARRADLAPVYRMIFRRLHRHGLDWVYSFPRLRVLDLRPLREALRPGDGPDWLGYAPEEALAREEAAREQQRQVDELRESLEAGYREAVEEALKKPPPKVVQAYRAVYGRWPRGWPPVC